MNIAFDFDGTLLDSRQRHVEVLRLVWPEVDNALSGDWVSRFWRCKLNGQSTRVFLQNENVGLSEEIANNWVKLIEDDRMLEYDELYPFAVSMLNALTDNHDLYLATARANENAAIEQFRKFSLNKYFHCTCVVPPGSGAGQRKTESLSEVSMDYVIGDTESDASWASSCGARFVPVAWGFRTIDYWRGLEYPAVSTPAELLKIFTIRDSLIL